MVREPGRKPPVAIGGRPVTAGGPDAHPSIWVFTHERGLLKNNPPNVEDYLLVVPARGSTLAARYPKKTGYLIIPRAIIGEVGRTLPHFVYPLNTRAMLKQLLAELLRICV